MGRVLANLFFIGVVVFLGYGLFAMNVRKGVLTDDVRSLQAQLHAIEEENNQIQKDIEYYSHPANLEKEARARLNVKKPGEKLIILTKRPYEDVEEDVPEEPGVPSLIDRIKKLFQR